MANSLIILTEAPFLDGLLQILVSGCDDTYVHMDVGSRTHGPHLLFLQGAQQLHLHFVWQVAHLVEKHRTTLGLLEDAFLVGDGRSEGAFQVAK